MLAQGGIDAHIGILGADTVDPGKLLMIGGTSVVHLFHPPAEHPMPGFWGPCPHTLIPDLWLVEGGQVSAGSVLAWLSNDIFQLDGNGTRRRIDEAAARPVNGSGLLTPDYFMGNRAPYLRGAVLGLSLWHDRVALASANVVAQADGLGVPIERIGGTGGGGVPHHRRLRGCAAATATGAGIFDDLHSAARAVALRGRQVDPDPAAHALYAEALERYRRVTLLLTDTMHELCDDRGVRPEREPHVRP